MCIETRLLRPGMFPISRDPPEGGTFYDLLRSRAPFYYRFPISRDPPEGGTVLLVLSTAALGTVSNF